MRALSSLLVLATLAGVAGPAAAQTVRGQVVETMSGVAVGGGFVVLVRMDGHEVNRTLADREGRFTVRAPQPGRYRLRSERIGFRITLSDPLDLAADETIEHRLDVKAVPIRLDEVLISAGESQCRVKPEEGRATAIVWEEARKALSAVAWSQRQQFLRATIRTFQRDVELDLTVKNETTQTKSGYTTRPFRARAAALLAAEGYVTTGADTMFVFYAPDAEVLFSDEFLSTHCLRLEPSGTRPGMVGLAFQPVGRRPQAEIRGVMWLDEKSAELHSVEFTYVNARLPAETDRAGGRVSFQPLVNGVWLVDHWYIRMPVFSRTERNDVRNLSVDMGSSRRVSTSQSQGQVVEVAAFREEGGELLDVFDRDGRRLAGATGATLAGSVFDSIRAVPLLDATVRVVGTGRTAQTGPGGRFRLDRMQAGTYELEFYHEDFPAWGVLRPGVRVELVREQVAETRLAVPPLARLLPSLCPNMPVDTAFAAVAGVVFDMVTGETVPGAGVQITWKNFAGQIGGDRVALTTNPEGLQTTTDADGYYRLCAVPTRQGGVLHAQVVMERRLGIPLEFRLTPGELKELNLMVPKR